MTTSLRGSLTVTAIVRSSTSMFAPGRILFFQGRPARASSWLRGTIESPIGEVLSVPGVAKTHKDFKADLYHAAELLARLTYYQMKDFNNLVFAGATTCSQVRAKDGRGRPQEAFRLGLPAASVRPSFISSSEMSSGYLCSKGAQTGSILH